MIGLSCAHRILSTGQADTAQYSYQTEGTGESEKITSDTVKYNGTQVLSASYTYDDKDNITNKLYAYKCDGDETTVDLINQYDDEDRITAIGYDSYHVYYTYDSNGQLSRVDDSYTNSSTTVYSYDSRGNITAKNVYPFTRNETITSLHTETKTFTYANFGWKDLLVAVDDVELTYDENGLCHKRNVKKYVIIT